MGDRNATNQNRFTSWRVAQLDLTKMAGGRRHYAKWIVRNRNIVRFWAKKCGHQERLPFSKKIGTVPI